MSAHREEMVKFWYPYVRGDIKLLAHAWVMYGRQRSEDSRTIIYRGIRATENDIATGIKMMGGMAGEW